MLNELREWRQIMTLVPPPIHNRQADNELAERSVLLCQNRLHYYNLWFFSLLVRSTYDNSVSVVSKLFNLAALSTSDSAILPCELPITTSAHPLSRSAPTNLKIPTSKNGYGKSFTTTFLT
ncbi:unnamed protein product [Cylicostephanus goldi]|uniref:Uncharacterized protein n=1 Tax=Cylicostephanus goldi TaxID=71465 RepID=A0A3P6QX15_CYLGO|nr:unnamed protein product [Cylicostephanus goldi]